MQEAKENKIITNSELGDKGLDETNATNNAVSVLEEIVVFDPNNLMTTHNNGRSSEETELAKRVTSIKAELEEIAQKNPIEITYIFTSLTGEPMIGLTNKPDLIGQGMTVPEKKETKVKNKNGKKNQQAKKEGLLPNQLRRIANWNLLPKQDPLKRKGFSRKLAQT